MISRFLLALVAVAMFTFSVAAEVLIVDGDTIDVDGVRIRINGIDAPEHGQKCGNWDCGKAATNEIARLIGTSDVTCESLGNDGYGRTIATCYVGKTDLGRELVRSGFAWAFVKYSQVYVLDESAAQKEKLGIWSTHSIPAWEYRAAKWADAEQDGPNGCPIKGNISKSGMIYHAPWSPWYKKTRIDETKGERWFCSEADAVASGWRAPRWH